MASIYIYIVLMEKAVHKTIISHSLEEAARGQVKKHTARWHGKNSSRTLRSTVLLRSRLACLCHLTGYSVSHCDSFVSLRATASIILRSCSCSIVQMLWKKNGINYKMCGLEELDLRLRIFWSTVRPRSGRCL